MTLFSPHAHGPCCWSTRKVHSNLLTHFRAQNPQGTQRSARKLGMRMHAHLPAFRVGGVQRSKQEASRSSPHSCLQKLFDHITVDNVKKDTPPLFRDTSGDQMSQLSSFLFLSLLSQNNTKSMIFCRYLSPLTLPSSSRLTHSCLR